MPQLHFVGRKFPYTASCGVSATDDLGAFPRTESVVHTDGRGHPLRLRAIHHGRSSMNELDGVTVLVVEDDDDTREVLKVMLEMCGARVFCADSARDGLQTFRREHPQAIVS